MPPHAILPTWRVTFPYVITGFPHVEHFYLATTPSADPSGHDTVGRAGFANVGVSTVFAPWWTNLASRVSPTGASFGNAHLDQFVGGAWVPVYTETNAVVPVSGSPNQLGWEEVISFYDDSHERMKVYIVEGVAATLARYIALPIGNAAVDEIMSSLVNYDGAALPVDPHAWALSRSNNYIGAFTSIVDAPSKHWRRKRGLG